ncbi:MAG: RNA polymerase sigma factor [Anaerolineaceae bacterium]
MTDIPQNMLNTRFEIWFEEEMPRLYRYLCYQTGDTAAAEEITARTCEKALSKVSQYDPTRGEMRAWMFGIARNELRAHFRSLRVSPAEVSLENLPEPTFPTDSPEQELQRKEVFTFLLRKLAGIPEREQEIIALRYGAGLSVAETAGILGITENNAAVLLHRTLGKLKKLLEEVPDGIQ